MPPQNGDFFVRAASCEGSEELTIDPIGGPPKGKMLNFFVSNQLVRPHIDQYNCLKNITDGDMLYTAENLVNKKKLTNYACKDCSLYVTRFTFLKVPSSASYSSWTSVDLCGLLVASSLHD